MRVLIIGAGLLGLTTAHFLRRHGCDVVVVERAPGPGLETSFANGGMLHASQANPWNEPGVLWRALKMLGREDSPLLFRPHALPRMLGWSLGFVRYSAPARYARSVELNARLAKYSLGVMRELRSECAFDYDYVGRGTLKIFRTPQEVAAGSALLAPLAGWDIPYTQVDGAGAAALEPALAPIADRIAGGVHFPQDEAGDAYRFCVGLAAQCAAAGVEFHYESGVAALSADGRGVRARLVYGREIAAGRCVIAAGSYTPLLARDLGLKVPVQPAKGYSITLPLNGWSAPPVVPVIDDHLHAAVCPLGDRLRVAGTAEFTGYDVEPTASRIRNLFGLVAKLYPAFAPHCDEAKAERWAGLRPMSADGVGIMGATKIPGVYLNTGHGPLGWTMAAGAGQAVADEVAGRPAGLDLAPYRLARF
ncbi:MAG: D-amino acid dehydrogenase [Gammaproteobacteria bacterium]|nr:D-amino acid dehydrogenase [Gammaproteobacteria bacterium]MBI5615580.1 D-amino acid dehydrogenase [Gammaproteobacteria bacterium]